MSIRAQGDRFAVWDDVLESSVHSEKWLDFLAEGYKTHSSDVAGHDLLTGDVEFGEPRFQTLAEAEACPAGDISRVIADYAVRSADVIGVSGADWAGFTLTPWKYHANAALNWHNDGAAENSKTAAAFVLYIHPVWDASWSGDLLILDLPGNDVRQVSIPDQYEGNPLGYQILHAGDPYCVMARPNRLALFKGDTYHAVRRVDPSAGSHYRASYTGFFLREDPRHSV
ncbi:2OG-Fe(II) oxygenase [Subtercola vilae]|uniref:Prolyl 4-hydroxylase alpha subunit Fe(2+) 2OG dioxygenase domain-containing protein n=1 Tax=Subtercola vilae TaxID=2056433 RepID=A0A4V6U546_9MICO|nr:2OG-Fe(II) oxygenase [Subtercola vilae]TIH27054.1 hypothetical protein D4765_18725 [Subtercola vilae]